MEESLDRSIVVVVGSDFTRQSVIGKKTVEFEGINDCRKLLDAAGLEFNVFLITPNYFRKNHRLTLDDHQILFNVITDADINSKVLGVLKRIMNDSRIRVVNHPAKIMSTTRGQVASRLEGLKGLIVPKTLRIDRTNNKNVKDLVANSSFRFPGILRSVGTHGGEGIRIVQDMDALLEYLVGMKTCYITEFANYKSDDGYYRKYRCFFIGDAIVFRHLIISDKWLIHARDKNRVMVNHDWMLREEEEIHSRGIEYFSDGQIETMRRIKTVIDLDYFGLDFSIAKTGNMLLFESNATMNFFPFFNDDQSHYSRQCLPHAIDAMRNLVETRLS